MSEKLAEILRTWLPSALQMVRPYFTPSDIEKGTRWSQGISQELEASQLGIFCMTAESLNSAWIQFEAGAISKVLGKGHVCPILFNITRDDLPGPLKEFQTTVFEEKEMRRLFGTINKASGNPLEDATERAVFDKWWPDLESKVSSAIKSGTTEIIPPKTDRVLLEEILELSRLNARRPYPAGVSPRRIERLAEHFLMLHELVSERASSERIMETLKSMSGLIQYFLMHSPTRPGGAVGHHVRILEQLSYPCGTLKTVTGEEPIQ